MSSIQPQPTNGFTSSEFPKDSEVKDIVKDIIEKRLGTDNILLGIIETVTISRIKGVGETIYLAYKEDEYIKKTIQKDYLKIIKDIEKTEFGSPIQYFNWYERASHYYVIDENSNPSKNKISASQILVIFPAPPEERGADDDEIKNFDKELTDKDLQDFYKTYTNCFLTKDWFKELPHYFILAKPISIQDKKTETFIPLGNLYVVIGTKHKVEINIYQELIKDLRRLWFYKSGDTILQEYSQKQRSDLYKPKLENHDNLKKRFLGIKGTKKKPEFEPFFTVNGEEITIDKLFYYAFDLPASQGYKNNFLLHSDSSLIKSIININPASKTTFITNVNNLLSKLSEGDPTNFIKKDLKGLKLLNSIQQEGIKYFFQLFSKRRFALILLYVYDLSEKETHTIITYGGREDNSTDESITIYLRENLFIYPGGFNFNGKLLSDKERLLLENTVSKIQEKYSDFSCKNFK